MRADISFLKDRISIKTAEAKVYLDVVRKIYYNNTKKPEAKRKVEFLDCFSKEVPTVVDEHELIIGSARFNGASRKLWDGTSFPSFCGNMGHVTVDYSMFINLGIDGIRKKIARLPDKNENKEIFFQTIDAFSHYIYRYAQAAKELAGPRNEMSRIAENCEYISRHAPRTFWQALQLLWFIQIFLHIEGMGAAVGIGRFDQYMYPYFSRDIENGELTREQAEMLISCFWIKLCESEESQNIALGGNKENELSLLCLDISEKLKINQPSVSARIGSATTEAFWEKAIRLVKSAQGQPAFFNDAIVSRALMNAGIEKADAEDYVITGCYEANPNGNALGLTVAYIYTLHPFLLDFLAKKNTFADFDSFYNAFKENFINEYRNRYVPHMRECWERIRSRYPSPFESICLNGCLDSGKMATDSGAKYTMFGMNALGLGTIVDSLYVIKKLVFEQKYISYEELVNEVLNNFSNRQLADVCKKVPGKYGTDNEETNEMAHDLSSLFAATMLENRFDEKILTYPGLFAFQGDIYTKDYPATPDGRLAGERMSYGISASDFCEGKSITSVLCSASHVANDLCACGNPVGLFIPPEALDSEEAEKNLRALIEGYFERGGFHLNINVTGIEDLKAAQKHPEQYEDLLIRISGYSAYFVSLDKTMQDALISRSQK